MEFTILVAVDELHASEFRLSFPTWIRHKTNLASCPIVVVHDDFGGKEIANLAKMIHSHAPAMDVAFVPVANRPHESQREKMLASLVLDGPRHIETKYYAKIDCDCIATGVSDWINPSWFSGDPAWIASKWGYTRPESMVPAFDRWADKFPEHFGSLRTAYEIDGRVARHNRMISYCQFGNTEWTRKMAELAGDRLPIPSQDTFLSLCATRTGALTRFAPMKQLGWRHIGGGGRRLAEAAAIAMELPVT